MHKRRYAKRGALFLFFLATIAAMVGAGGQEKQYLLREVDAVGDVSEVEMSTNLRMEMRGTTAGRELPSFDMYRRERRKYREAVLGLDKNENPSAVRRTYSVAREVEQRLGGELDQTVSSLQGKTITLRRGGNNKVTIQVARGKLDAKARGEINNDLDQMGRTYFPNRALAPGDTWTLDSSRLSEAFEGAQKAAIKGKFAEVTTFNGHPCARVELTVEVTGRLPSGTGIMELTLNGNLYHALDLQRTLSMTLDGSVTGQGQERVRGMLVNYSGEGTMEMDFSERWLTVGDKPGRSRRELVMK